MKLTITACLIFFSPFLFSQSLSKLDLVGTWAVKEFILPEMNLDENQMMLMEDLKNGFLKSSYQFLSDNTFKLNFEEGVPEIMSELEFVNNAIWKYNESTGLINIGTLFDNYSLLVLEVVAKKGKIYFMIEETPFLMEVVKY